MTERLTLFADVLLPLSIPGAYTYRVPFELNEQISSGKRVIVPFGKSKFYTGVVYRVHQNIPQNYTAKYLEVILDDAPIVTEKQFQLWEWMSDYYMANMGDVVNAALPGNFKLASETKICLHPSWDGDTGSLKDREILLVDALTAREELTLVDASEIMGLKTVQPVIKKLIEHGVVVVSEEVGKKFKPKFSSFVQVSPTIKTEAQLSDALNELENSGRSAKQVAAMLRIAEMGGWSENRQKPILKKDLISAAVPESALKALQKKGLITIFNAEVSRIASETATALPKELSAEQNRAYDEILAHFSTKDVVLLHGVTSSGKTEIYVKLIFEALKQNNQVLMLIPEIALTTQLISRLRKYFGEKIGVYHSRFSQNERIEIWNHVLAGDHKKFRIVIGARSSVFLPFRNLGLIIVDEEHESSFKQFDPAPRYNARDTAVVLGKMYGTKILLGSATPSLESYHNAMEGRYGLVTLGTRFGGVQLPKIECADLKHETEKKTMQSHFSSFLLDKMRTALDKNEQIILFQNRRGFSPMWICEMCAWTPNCVNCDVSLTYHKSSNALKCHYCGHFMSPPASCGACGSRSLKMVGFGTEKIEEDLATYLPGAKIRRMDLDTTRAKTAYENIINDFENREIDVLIGTQMVTKGLDFDNVGLVGILSADMMLKFPDFRAFERSFQLMSQVAGRAGRKDKQGTVVIQAYRPDHWVIDKVKEHDYNNFARLELLERKNFAYPPFYRLVVLKIKHRQAEVVEVAAAALAKSLRESFGERVLGPEFPVVARVRNFFIKHITLKFERSSSAKKVKDIMLAKINAILAIHDFRSVRIDIDVDPQ